MNCLQNSEEYNHELKYIITLDGGTTNTRAYLWSRCQEYRYGWI